MDLQVDHHSTNVPNLRGMIRSSNSKILGKGFKIIRVFEKEVVAMQLLEMPTSFI